MKGPDKFSKLMLASAITLALTACGGGGGGGSSTTTTTPTVSGVVSSTSSTVAKLGNEGLGEKLLAMLVPTATADLVGLQPVSGATVQLIALNPDGSEGNVIASATTDSNGNYTLDIDPATLDASYILKVGSTTPIRAPFTGSTVNINPATEAVVEAVLAQVSSTLPITNFTVEELAALVNTVEQQNIDFSADTTVADAVNSVTGTVTTLAETVTSVSGSTDTSTAIGGDYHMVTAGGYLTVDNDIYTAYNCKYSATTCELNHLGLGIDVGSGSVTASNGTVGFTHTSTSAETSIDFLYDTTLPALDSFGMTAARDSGADSGTTSYVVGSDHRLFVNVDSGTLVGAISTDGSLFAAVDADDSPFTGSDGRPYKNSFRGLDLFVKKSTTAPVVANKTYHVVSLDTNLVSGPNYAYPEVTTGAGTVTMDSAGTTASFNINNDLLQLQIEGATNPSTSTDSGTAAVSVAADGTLSIGGVAAGAVKSDGSFFTFKDSDNTTGGSGDYRTVLVAIEQGSGMTNASLSGTYNVVGLGTWFVDTTAATSPELLDAAIGTGVSTFTLTFDGAGNATLGSGIDNDSEASLNGGAPYLNRTSTAMTSTPLTYSVSGSGLVTVSGPVGATILGAVSADGNTIGFTFTDGTSRTLNIGFKQ